MWWWESWDGNYPLLLSNMCICGTLVYIWWTGDLIVWPTLFVDSPYMYIWVTTSHLFLMCTCASMHPYCSHCPLLLVCKRSVAQNQQESMAIWTLCALMENCWLFSRRQLDSKISFFAIKLSTREQSATFHDHRSNWEFIWRIVCSHLYELNTFWWLFELVESGPNMKINKAQ